jgi:hypothetical protein
MRPSSPSPCLFDHPVRPDKDFARDRQAESLGSPQVDGKLDPIGAFNRQVSGMGSPENFCHEPRRLAPLGIVIGAIGEQAPIADPEGGRKHHRHLCCKRCLQDLSGDVQGSDVRGEESIPRLYGCQGTG